MKGVVIFVVGFFLGLVVGVSQTTEPTYRTSRAGNLTAQEASGGEYLDQTLGLNSEPTTSRHTEPNYTKKAIYAKRDDNIRTGPGTNYEVLRRTERGERLVWDRQEGSWYHLTDEASDAWVHGTVVYSEEEFKRASEAEVMLAELAVIDVGGGWAKASGIIANISGSPIRDVEATATFYGVDGKYVGQASALISTNPIGPGETSTFEVLGSDFAGSVHSGSVSFNVLFGRKLKMLRKEDVL